MTPDREALRRAAEKATPGPWVSQGRYIGTPNHMGFIGEVRDQNGNWSDTAKSTGDAAFIALNNPTTCVALLDDIDRLEADRDALQARVEKAEAEAEAFKATLAKAGYELITVEAKLAQMRQALTLALARLEPLEPGDSRAVSDEFVAMAAIVAGIGNKKGDEIIEAALATLQPEERQ